MKIVKKFQEGGAMPAGAAPVQDPAMAPAAQPGGEGQDPIMQLAQVFMQGLQAQDCGMLAQGAEMFLQLVQGAMGGGEPGAAPEQPVFKKGGKILKRGGSLESLKCGGKTKKKAKKACDGAKMKK